MPIRGKQLADNTITNIKIADDAIDSRNYIDSSIDGEHLSSSAKQSTLESRRFSFYQPTTVAFAAGNSTSLLVTDRVISDSFYKLTNGDETTAGIVTSAPENFTIIRDSATNDPIEDNSNRQVFGRVTRNVTGLSGSLTFTNGSTAVTGSGTSFTTEVSANDYIYLNSLGYAVKVASVTDNTNLVLSVNYVPVNGSGASSKVTITLSYFVDITGTETAHTMSNQNIEILFPESYSLFDAPFSGLQTGQGFVENLPASHIHDGRYFTETELGATGGAALIGVDDSGWSEITGSDVQAALDSIDSALGSVGGAVDPKYIIHKFTSEAVSLGGTFVQTLPSTPATVTKVSMFVNGVRWDYGSGNDFTVSGTAVTVSATAEYAIETTDKVHFIYVIA